MTATKLRRERPMDPILREALCRAKEAFNCSWFDALKYAKANFPEIRRAAAERDAEQARQKALFAAWTHPIGTPVWVRRDNGVEQPTRTRGRPWMAGGHPVILLKGIAGGFLLERVRLREAA